MKFLKNKATKKVVLGGAVGSASGAIAGSYMGIAILGTAIPGTAPVAMVGGLVGVLGVLACRALKKNP